MNLLASSLISMMLLMRARTGASGKAATNNVTNPNWITVNETQRTEGDVKPKGDKFIKKLCKKIKKLTKPAVKLE